MKHIVIVATVALGGMLLAAGQSTYAQDNASANSEQADTIVVYSDIDAQAVLDARIVALRTVLTLTPDQEKLWLPVETAIRKIAVDSIARGKERSEAQPPADFLDVLTRVAKAEATRAADLERFVGEAAPLVASLSDEQKNRMPAFLGMVADPAALLSTGSLWLFEEEQR
jgi:hypothetical protein